jgi:anaerobic selenocysteine-containing dehydrogenase
MAEAESSNESPAAAVGFGPNAAKAFSQENYHHPAAGWGAAMSVTEVLLKQGEILDGTRAVLKMNHENGGFDCPGCAWPDDRKGLRLDICENGIKHSTWEMTRKRVTSDFFAAHTVSDLMRWSDFALEDVGRLTAPRRYDPASDKYLPVAWDEAFALAGRHFQKLDSPDRAAFYTSGRLSNEATFLYQLFARESAPTIFRMFEYVSRSQRKSAYRSARYGQRHGGFD